MMTRSVATYFAVPALVVLWLLSGGPVSLSEAVLFGSINYVLFALPQICWFGIARFIQASSTMRHAGFLGATLPLIGLMVSFECCIDNSNALGWAYYWPFAAAGIALFVWIASVIDRARHEFTLGITAMNISPRHLAAAQYTMIAVFAVASWYVLLSPMEGAREQLVSMFAPGAANREFFVWLVIANLLTLLVAVSFWFKRAALYPLAPILVCVSVALLAWALWWSDVTFILIYALGCIFSIWSWRRPNPSFKRDALTRAP